MQLSPLLCGSYIAHQAAIRLWEIAGRGYDPTHSVPVSDPQKSAIHCISYRLVPLSYVKGTTGSFGSEGVGPLRRANAAGVWTAGK